jgi:ribosomal protein L37AE/L43A
MNSRIYTEKSFRKEIEKLKLKYYFCPNCFGNDLTDRIDYLQLFGNYYCKTCQLTFDKFEALTKDKVREIKINNILYEK